MENNQVPGKGAGIASLIFGIISVVTCWFGAWGACVGQIAGAVGENGASATGYIIAFIPIVLGLLGLILSIMAKKSAKAVGASAGGVSTVGLVFSIIGLVLSLVFFIACMVAASSALSAAS